MLIKKRREKNTIIKSLFLHKTILKAKAICVASRTYCYSVRVFAVVNNK